jgi:hypothetical protein
MRKTGRPNAKACPDCKAAIPAGTHKRSGQWCYYCRPCGWFEQHPERSVSVVGNKPLSLAERILHLKTVQSRAPSAPPPTATLPTAAGRARSRSPPPAPHAKRARAASPQPLRGLVCGTDTALPGGGVPLAAEGEHLNLTEAQSLVRDRIVEWLQTPDGPRACCVVGPSGSGKATVVRAALRVSDAVWNEVDAALPETETTALAEIAKGARIKSLHAFRAGGRALRSALLVCSADGLLDRDAAQQVAKLFETGSAPTRHVVFIVSESGCPLMMCLRKAIAAKRVLRLFVKPATFDGGMAGTLSARHSISPVHAVKALQAARGSIARATQALAFGGAPHLGACGSELGGAATESVFGAARTLLRPPKPLDADTRAELADAAGGRERLSAVAHHALLDGAGARTSEEETNVLAALANLACNLSAADILERSPYGTVLALGALMDAAPQVLHGRRVNPSFPTEDWGSFREVGRLSGAQPRLRSLVNERFPMSALAEGGARAIVRTATSM